jgi:hypothetical protein
MPSNSRIGFILGDTQRGVDMLIASGARPRVVTVHNNVGHAQQLHTHLGDDTIIILRMTAYENIVIQDEAPAVRAVQWCQALEPVFKQAPWAYFEVGPPLMEPDEWTAEFWVAAMNWMHARGYKAVVLHVGEGNPQVPSGGGDGWAPMWPVVQLAASYGYILGPQAYWIDGKMDLGDDWHAFRILRAFRDYPGKWPAGTRIVHTEFGIDLRGGDTGWKSSGCGADAYRRGLNEASEKFRLATYPPGVELIGFTIFALHENGLWNDFNFWEIYQGLLDDIKAQQSMIEVPPEPPEMVGTGDYTVIAYALNVRSGPGVSNTKVGVLRNGDLVNVLETVGDWSRIEPVVQNWVCNDYLEEVK